MKKRKSESGIAAFNVPSAAVSDSVGKGTAPGLQKVRVKAFLHLPPKYIGRIREGVNDHFRDMLLKHIPKFKGILLSFSDIAFLAREKSAAKIKYDSPYMHFHVLVTLYLFCPVVDEYLVGIVNKISPNHIGCIVYGLFNASIPAVSIPTPLNSVVPTLISGDAYSAAQYEYLSRGTSDNQEDEGWRLLNASQSHISTASSLIRPGSVIRFRVSKIVQGANEMMSLQGSLTDAGCGILDVKGYTTLEFDGDEWNSTTVASEEISAGLSTVDDEEGENEAELDSVDGSDVGEGDED